MSKETKAIESNRDRYTYGLDRGHREFITEARRNEDFYLGGGLQWNEEDKAYLEEMGRPTVEMNAIFPAVNTAVGHQLQSRADINYKPRNGEADQATADVLTKVVMQITNDIKYPWLESQIFTDGIIQQRGFMDLRITFDENMNGTVSGDDVDPMDIIIDPDAQGYDPERWADVIVVRWMTVDDIEELYGKKKADEAGRKHGSDHGELEVDFEERSHYGSNPRDLYSDTWTDDSGTRRILVIDRQYRKLSKEDVYVSPLGDIVLAANLTDTQRESVVAQGYTKTKRLMKRIRWTVSTKEVLLHDDWSPYRTYTIIPYFPYFRRGRTRGMVDNLISPQELHNKSLSQFQHILSTTANSGFFVPKGSLSNMTVADLEDFGSKTGLVIEYEGTEKPEKIQPNQMPVGIDRVIDRTEMAVKNISGISDAMQGLQSNEISGKAIQSKQFQGQVQLSGPLDNLAMTRFMVGRKLLELVQDFYTEERVVMITDDADVANIQHQPLPINTPAPTGEIVNDVTLGTYDVVVSEQPLQATFQENQFTQLLEMRNAGVNIPDVAIVEMSSLSKKGEIVKAMQNASEYKPTPLEEAQTEEKRANTKLKEAQIGKIGAETTNLDVDAQYSAIQTANVIATTPVTAPMADKLLKSAGYQDKDAPPIVPNAPMPSASDVLMPPNIDPTTPVPVPTPESPAVGARQGIETPEND